MDRQQRFRRSTRPMLVFDDARTVLDANRMASVLLRMRHDRVLGLNLDDLVAEDDRPWLDEVLAPVTDGARTNGDGADDDEQGRRTRTLPLVLAMPDGGRPVVDMACEADLAPGRHLLVCDLPSADGDARFEAGRLLTTRERQVLTQVAVGRTGPEIAADLVLAPATVESHVSRALGKLRARNRPHGVAIALRRGEIDADVFATDLPPAPERPPSAAPDGRVYDDPRRPTIDTVADPVAVVDETGAILAVNDRWTVAADGPGAGPGDDAVHGLERVLGAGPGRELDAVAVALRRVLAGEVDDARAEVAGHGPAGPRDFEVGVERQAGDGPVRARIRIRDVTERRLRERVGLREQAALDGLEIALVLSTGSGVVESWRGAATTLFGWSPAEALGRRIDELVFERLAPAALDERMRIVATGTPWAGGVRLRRRDGSVFDAWVRHRAVSVAVAGDDRARIATEVSDASALVACRRAAHATAVRLDATVEAMRDGMVRVGADGSIEQINRVGADMVGRTPAQLRGRSLSALRRDVAVVPDDRAGRPRAAEEAGEVLRRDGMPLPVLCRTVAFDAGDGDAGALVLFRHDDSRTALRSPGGPAGHRRRAIGRALAGHGPVVRVQPLVEVATGRRLRDVLLPDVTLPDGGPAGPDRVRAVADDLGLGRMVDERLLEEAARATAKGARVEVDLSWATAPDFGLIGRLEDVFGLAGAELSRCVLAIPATAVRDEPGHVATLVRGAADRGCTAVLTGFEPDRAGLAHLQDLPWDEVRMDGRFALELRRQPAVVGVVRAVADLVRARGLRVGLAGVDDDEMGGLLGQLGIDVARGDALGRPMPSGAGTDGARG
ncbi:MAG: EAL domain-containing protein [Solirubrobacteraceae bacterium]